ncbi:DUF2024 family protein [Flavobacterium sp. DG1-102-2]|uniref:DUF2024 family protein n=1 Tax=Flavobacterium sp. DG1-102-2 TaxID=3081663 RepID=UPI0029491A88|nr:DUF2024 family protein [Flavobacterium sp. DG1-102-2]MDV6170255.1 DUF2024 family protein [Flavobacterium sp. DG1-102-2]
MKIAVWDIYVSKKDGSEMHFDILAPDHINDLETIYAFGKDYLSSKNEAESSLSAKECSFCHIEQATPEIEQSIAGKGYYIIEMEGCE